VDAERQLDMIVLLPLLLHHLAMVALDSY
jgi:hypothetical protein